MPAQQSSQVRRERQVVDEHHTEDTRSHESVLRSERQALLSWHCTARCWIPVSFQFLGWCPFVMYHGLLRVL